MKKKKEIMTDPILKKSHRHPVKQTDVNVCGNCLGRGVVKISYGTMSDMQEAWVDCPTCHGEGATHET